MSTRFGFVSTFPPTQCGLATFTESLREALVAATGDEGSVIRLVEGGAPRPADHVVAQWVAGDPSSMRTASDQLNNCDVAIIQHEYGVYGGHDGDEVLALLDSLEIPSIVVLHTVLSAPTPHQRDVLEAVVAKAAAVVTMTHAAHERLADGYAVDLASVRIIAHGAREIPPKSVRSAPLFRSGRSTILTWGLLGPGKGIEWGIEAMALLRDVAPMPEYLIAGQTHPKVLAHEGEDYRDGLHRRVRTLGLSDAVTFDGRYRDSESLPDMIRAADVVLLPYDSTEQVTSGVLIEAVAAGKPVVATEFPHARELLAGGAGLVVPIAIRSRSPRRCAPSSRDEMLPPRCRRAARRQRRSCSWSAVAEQYRELAEQLITASVAA